MSSKQRKLVIYLVLCLFVSLGIMVKSDGFTADNTGIVVVFDEAHGQFFNRSLFRLALADLTDFGINIVFNTQPINNTTLEGTDLFISTNPSDFFSTNEQYFLEKHLLSGKSALLLANPLDEENDSLNGRGDIFNQILGQANLETVIGFWTYSEDIGAVKRTDRVLNDFSNAGQASYLILDVNTSTHELLGLDNSNVTSLVTASCSVTNLAEEIILASSEAYAKTVLGSPHSYSSTIALFASAGEQIENGQIILGGSSLMFSDLYDPVLNSTWYNSSDNSIFWQNLVKWLVQKEETQSSSIPPTTMEMIVYLSVFAIIGLTFIVSGSVFFLVGSGRKLEIAKLDEIIPVVPKKSPPATPSTETAGSSQKVSKESKRERRIKQIQKHPPRSQRKRK